MAISGILHFILHWAGFVPALILWQYFNGDPGLQRQVKSYRLTIGTPKTCTINANRFINHKKIKPWKINSQPDKHRPTMKRF